jgi:hypothetical protein
MIKDNTALPLMDELPSSMNGVTHITQQEMQLSYNLLRMANGYE